MPIDLYDINYLSMTSSNTFSSHHFLTIFNYVSIPASFLSQPRMHDGPDLLRLSQPVPACLTLLIPVVRRRAAFLPADRAAVTSSPAIVCSPWDSRCLWLKVMRIVNAPAAADDSNSPSPNRARMCHDLFFSRSSQSFR